MAGTLYVVATPIGNLEDITLRALRVLGEVAVVAAEDTRRTGQLLRHFQLATRVIGVREHNEERQSRAVVERLRQGESVALVTDAGTPAVADPGARVVRAVAEAGFQVVPIPGPSAVIAAVSAAGVADDSFTFLGFPPIRGNDRTTWFGRLDRVRAHGGVVFFEAPHRIVATLERLENVVNDQIVLFRELTKFHETTYRGTPGEIRRALTVVAGEFTVVIPRSQGTALEAEPVPDTEVVRLFGQITDMRARDAARSVAARTGRSANEVYALVRRYRA